MSVSVAHSQTPAKAACPRTWAVQCVAWSACLAPSLHRYQFILLGEQRHACVNNKPRAVCGAEQPGLESATSRLQVWCPNHYATLHKALRQFLSNFCPSWQICTWPKITGPQDRSNNSRPNVALGDNEILITLVRFHCLTSQPRLLH